MEIDKDTGEVLRDEADNALWRKFTRTYAVTRLKGFCGERSPRYVRMPYERIRVFTPVVGESMTLESHAIESDINRIVERYKREGVLPETGKQPRFEDVSGLNGDLTGLLNKAAGTLEAASGNDKQLRAKRAKAQAADVLNPTPPPGETLNPGADKPS